MADFEVQQADGSTEISADALSASIFKLNSDLNAAEQNLNRSIRERVASLQPGDIPAGIQEDGERLKKISDLADKAVNLITLIRQASEGQRGIQGADADQAFLSQIAAQEQSIANEAKGLGVGGLQIGPLAAPGTLDKFISIGKTVAVIAVAVAVFYIAFQIHAAVA